MKPKELEAQSPVKIVRWVDIDSDDWRELDDTPAFTKKCLKFGFEEPAFMFCDSLGRVWCKPQEEGKPFVPFHFEYGSTLIGYRISKKAAN